MAIKRKYRNEPTQYNGEVFDSLKELHRYKDLCLLTQSGHISGLERQKRFEVVPKQADEHACHYLADFVYKDEDCGQWVIEDVKSPASRTPAYVIKRKLVKLQYPNFKFLET